MKRLVGFLLCFWTLMFPLYVNAEETGASTDLAPGSKSAILIEASTGTVIYEKNSHEKLPPASMTKMMSMLLVVEGIENGIIGWDDVITVSENASSMGGSQILLEAGEQMTVSDLFKGVAVMSGNDAVVALAEAIAGSTDEFVAMMNKRAKELGLTDTNFKNPHGLDDANHYSSAYDMSLIAKELVKHEKVLEFTQIYEDYLRKGTDKELWLVNTNKLVRFYPGIDGLKTGYTSTAGYCLTATAKKNNMRLIAVAMGEESSTTRNAEVSAMLDYGYAQYKIDTILNKDDVIAKMTVEKAKKEQISLVPKNSVTLLNKKITKLGQITYKLDIDSVKAPVKVGDVVGKLTILNDGKEIQKVELTVSEDVQKANLFELYVRYLKDIVSGNISI